MNGMSTPPRPMTPEPGISDPGFPSGPDLPPTAPDGDPLPPVPPAAPPEPMPDQFPA